MKRMKKTVMILLTMVAASGITLWLTGCQTCRAGKETSAKSRKAGCPTMRQDGDKVVYSRAFPTGNDKSSVVLLETAAPAEVMVGESFLYSIKATNLTACPLDDVVVTDRFGDKFRLDSSEPKAGYDEAKGAAEWTVGGLAGNETKVITAKVTAKEAGQFPFCATVSYNTSMCRSIAVIAPKLQLVRTAPASVLICEPIPVRLVVSNTGTGTVRNVQVTDALPEGLITADNKNAVTFDAGTLAAGQAKEFSFMAKATKTGEFKNGATAKSESGLTVEAAATTTLVQQPVLTLAKEATKAQFAGRNIDYAITVANTGDAVARNVMVTDMVPAGTKFVAATEGGKLADGKITWTIAALEPKASAKVGATLKTEIAGTITNSATVTAVCATPATANASTELRGVSGILLQMVDVEDPIEVGNPETYVITVANQGNAADTNIKVVLTLEENEAYVSSTGATVGKVEGNVITFAPVAKLAPKAEVRWQIVVKAVKAGTVQTKAEMTSDQITRPSVKIESTTIY